MTKELVFCNLQITVDYWVVICSSSLLVEYIKKQFKIHRSEEYLDIRGVTKLDTKKSEISKKKVKIGKKNLGPFRSEKILVYRYTLGNKNLLSKLLVI